MGRQVQLEQLEKQGRLEHTNTGQANSRNKDLLQSSQGKQSGDSDQQVTAMLEKIDKERKLNPSHSAANPMLQLRHETSDYSHRHQQHQAQMRVDRGFTIHDIEKSNQSKNKNGDPERQQQMNQNL